MPTRHPKRRRPEPRSIAQVNDQAASLILYIERTGDPAPLEKVTTLLGKALEAIPESSSDRVPVLGNLSAALRLRYQYTGDLAFLNEAVNTGRTAVASASEGHHRIGAMANLALALQNRYERTGRRDDLREAIVTSREAVRNTRPEDPDYARLQSNLGITLQAHYGQTNDLKDLSEAISVGRAAVDATPEDHPNRAGRLTNLGIALRMRYERTHDLVDLYDAIATSHAAVNATPESQPIRASRLANLGRVLRLTYQLGVTEDGFDAVASFRQAAEMSGAPVQLRINAARSWGELAADLNRWELAAQGFSTATELLPLAAWRALDRTDQEYALVEYAGTGGDAAACAIACGRYEQALTVVEQGRGVLLAQSLETRSDRSALHERHPLLAERLDALRRDLDEAQVALAGTQDSPNLKLRERTHLLAQEWEELVERARALPGFGDFLRLPGFEQLQATAALGPIVVINLSRYRCDALCVTSTGLRLVPLAMLTVDELLEHVNAFLKAVRTPQRPSSPVIMAETLEWLWDVAAHPVLHALGYTATPTRDQPWSRVWWSLTGPLAFLPIHAAGRNGSAVMDLVISSYTPTVRALAHARSSPRSATPRSEVLVVALPKTPGKPDLPNADREAHLISDRIPTAKLLIGPQAIRRRVRDALPHAAVAHFSCHGVQHIHDPSTGGLDLHDGRFAVLDVSRLDLKHAEIVYLSACETALGGAALADESIHLAGALQLAGYRQAIGTLWRVPDAVAADVAERVYERLSHGNSLRIDEIATALHETVRWLRDTNPDQPFLWAAYIHAGP
jgi:hypothetical protein